MAMKSAILANSVHVLVMDSALFEARGLIRGSMKAVDNVLSITHYGLGTFPTLSAEIT